MTAHIDHSLAAAVLAAEGDASAVAGARSERITPRVGRPAAGL